MNTANRRQPEVVHRSDAAVAIDQVVETTEVSSSEERINLRQQDEGTDEPAGEPPVSDYDLTCAGYVRKKLGGFITLLVWGMASACSWGAAFWCCGQLRNRVPSQQLLFAASAPLLLTTGAALLARHFQHGSIASIVRYHWRPILFSSVLLSVSLQLAFRAAQQLPLATDAACIWFSYAGIMSLPLCFVLQISCTHYGILAAVLTVINLALLSRPAFLRVALAGISVAGGGGANSTNVGVWSVELPPTPPGDFVGCAAAAVMLAVAVTVVYWKLSGVSALPLLALTSVLVCAASFGLQLLTEERPLRPPQLRAADAPLAFGSIAGVAGGLPVLLHWLRSERSRLFQFLASTAISIAQIAGVLATGRPPDAISLVTATLAQLATGLVTLGQMRHESWLQYREDSKYKYSRLTILPDTPFQTLQDAHGAHTNGSASPGLAETSFNSVTVRRQSDSGNHNGDPFFQEVNLLEETHEDSANGSVVDSDSWKPLKLR